MKVEGFTNYATAGVAMTLDNDRAMSEQVAREVARIIEAAPRHENVAEGIWTVEETCRFAVADWLKDYVERSMENGTREGDAGLLATQLARAGFGEVDWEDLAEHYGRRHEEAMA